MLSEIESNKYFDKPERDNRIEMTSCHVMIIYNSMNSAVNFHTYSESLSSRDWSILVISGNTIGRQFLSFPKAMLFNLIDK